MLLTYRARVERADSSETLIALTVPEKPGFFKKFYDCVYPRNVRAHLGRTEPAVNKTVLGACRTSADYSDCLRCNCGGLERTSGLNRHSFEEQTDYCWATVEEGMEHCAMRHGSGGQ